MKPPQEPTTRPEPDVAPDAVATPEARTTIERIAAIVNDLNWDPESLKQAPRDIQLSLVATVAYVAASFFEWWSGFARMHSIVNYSATGSGNAYTDWRGWIGVALMCGVAGVSAWQLAYGTSPLLRKVAVGCGTGALVATLWFWAAFSTAVGMSDGLTVQFGGGFGLYLGLASAVTACVGTVRQYRSGLAVQ